MDQPTQAHDPQEPPVAVEAPAPPVNGSAQPDAETAAPAAQAPAPDAPPVEASAPEAPPAEAPPAEAPAAETAAAEAPAAEPASEAPATEAKPAPEPKPKPQLTPEQIAANEARRKAAQEAWQRVVGARETNETLEGTVTAAIKGGLLVDVGGIRGFLPASQVRVEQGAAIEGLVKTKIPLRVIDIDQSRRRIVVSHRRAVDGDRRARRTELLKSLQLGQVREATVVRLTDFGAFVDLGGVDGLIPMRELAFERVEKVSDVLNVGDKLPVEVIRIEDGGKKIALSRKNALPDPWRDHATLLQRGNTVEGKVVAKEPRLQVELAPGVVGSIRESDANPEDYEIGETVEVQVRNADRRTRRITLSTAHAAQAAVQQAQPTSSGFAPLGVELGRRINSN